MEFIKNALIISAVSWVSYSIGKRGLSGTIKVVEDKIEETKKNIKRALEPNTQEEEQ